MHVGLCVMSTNLQCHQEQIEDLRSKWEDAKSECIVMEADLLGLQKSIARSRDGKNQDAHALSEEVRTFDC